MADKDKWYELAKRTHQEQVVWFLNAFWGDDSFRTKENVESIWDFLELFKKLSAPNSDTACDLDEFFSHKFLEEVGETMTVLKLRATLSEIDVDKNKRMCISEFLLFKFKRSVRDLVNAPQGDEAELQAAQKLVDAADEALNDVLARLEAQKEAVKRSKEATRKAEQDEQAAIAAEQQAAKDSAAAAKAVEDQKKAAEELQAQQKAYDDKVATLRKKSEEGGVVSRNKAKNELEQLLAEDPLPLRQAKITQDAAVRKSEKAHQLSLKSEAEAKERRIQAGESKQKAKDMEAKEEEAARELEKAVAEAEAKRDEAMEYLNRVKNSGNGAGAAWFMTRSMYERQKFLPKSKQTMSYPEV